MMNLRGTDTVREWAEKLVRQHRPLAPQFWLPDFMKPNTAPATLQSVLASTPSAVAEPAPAYTASRPVICASCGKHLSGAEQEFCTNKASVFDGKKLCMAHQKEHRQAKRSAPPLAAPATPAASEAPPADKASSGQKKLVCATCGAKISFDEGRFCWNQERRFGGLQYCRTHQADFR